MSALRKVLVVDDDPVVGTSFNRVLSGKGYLVITAENGAEALKKLQDEKPDLVFTDIKMPGMSGIEVAERVRARQPWTPVVIVTGYGSQANEQRAKAAGVAEFLRKPLSPEMIEESAAKALHQTAPPQAAAPPVVAEAATVVAEPTAEAGKPHLLRNMALFLSAPFVGLLYAVLLPFVGLGMLAWTVAEPLFKGPKFRAALRSLLGATQSVAKGVAGAFLGLAFVLLFPVVGPVMLVWVAVTGRAERAPAE
jgi:CheY-like chemotaxis protein